MLNIYIYKTTASLYLNPFVSDTHTYFTVDAKWDRWYYPNINPYLNWFKFKLQWGDVSWVVSIVEV